MIKLSSYQEASLLIAILIVAMEAAQGATHFSENLFIKEGSCAKQHFFSRLNVQDPIVECESCVSLHSIQNSSIEEFGQLVKISS